MTQSKITVRIIVVGTKRTGFPCRNLADQYEGSDYQMITTDILKFVDLHMHHGWNPQILFTRN